MTHFLNLNNRAKFKLKIQQVAPRAKIGTIRVVERARAALVAIPAKSAWTFGHNTLYESILGITKPATRGLSFRGGTKRISSYICEETRVVLRSFLKKVLCDSVDYTQHAMRNTTVTTLDVFYTFKCQGRTVYSLTDEQNT